MVAGSGLHLVRAAAVSGVAIVGAGCYHEMMPTPAVFWEGHVDPFEYMPADQRTTSVEIFYATDRPASGKASDRSYGNGRGDALRLGVATVRLGGDDLTWSELAAASVQRQRRHPVPLIFRNATELGALSSTVGLKQRTTRPELADSAGQRAFAEAINRQLDRSWSKDVNIYVHGANVDFENACVVSAALFHFMARDAAMIAFSWPTRQNILLYPLDIRQAVQSVPNFVDLLDFLALNTNVRKINILSYSAGGPLLSRGLALLRERYAGKDSSGLDHDQKIGNVFFAASDVSLHAFAREDLESFYELPTSIRITISESDEVLGFARLMHGSSRLGAPDLGDLTAEEIEDLSEKMDKIDVIDVTYNQGAGNYEGFTGHGHWYKNALVSTDVLASFRFYIPADERGLERIEGRQTWYFPGDYPQRIVDVVLSGRFDPDLHLLTPRE